MANGDICATEGCKKYSLEHSRYCMNCEDAEMHPKEPKPGDAECPTCGLLKKTKGCTSLVCRGQKGKPAEPKEPECSVCKTPASKALSGFNRTKGKCRACLNKEYYHKNKSKKAKKKPVEKEKKTGGTYTPISEGKAPLDDPIPPVVVTPAPDSPLEPFKTVLGVLEPLTESCRARVLQAVKLLFEDELCDVDMLIEGINNNLKNLDVKVGGE